MSAPPRSAKATTTQHFPRRRCHNCGKLYPLTKPNRRFCSDTGPGNCKAEYNRYGSAFGPIRDYLEKEVQRRSKEAARIELNAFLASDQEFIQRLHAAGFIHRSQIKKHPIELTRLGLKGGLDMATRLLRELNARITALEEFAKYQSVKLSGCSIAGKDIHVTVEAPNGLRYTIRGQEITGL